MQKGCSLYKVANGGVPEMDNTVPSLEFFLEGVTTNADECKHVGLSLAQSEVRGKSFIDLKR